jgi:hypothetical protein
MQAGYPAGIPPTDYYPVLAYLARCLEPDEVTPVVSTLEAEMDGGGHGRRPPDQLR